MTDYLILDEIQIPENDLSEQKINDLYEKGYLITRKQKGAFFKSRSLRIDLSKFRINTKNRRVLNRNQDIEINYIKLPMGLKKYSWKIHQLGKNFYFQKFGDNIMSASKIKSMFTTTNENPNFVFEYSIKNSNKIVGYTLCLETNKILHYAYPFYDLTIPTQKFLGMAMLVKAILFAKESKKDYFYIGTVVEKKSEYKLQFNGLEWFNEETNSWSTNIKELKNKILN